MAITRLAISNPAATTNTILYTAPRPALVSVIATNKSPTIAANVRIWIQPQGSSSESQYSYIAYDALVPVANSMETFRFPVMTNDVIYIRSSTANLSFSLNGIYETNGTSNISTGTSNPSNPAIGDVFVNTSTGNVLYWTGSEWVNGVADTSLYPFSKYQATAPTSPVVGQIWVDSDDTVQYMWTGSAWTALSNPDNVTLNAVQTLTNKTLTSPVLNTPTLNTPTLNTPQITVGINAQTTSYSAVLSDRDKVVEISNASANNFVIPTNASVAFPIGSTITITQTGAGQTTIAPASGAVTVNGTPGLKLRTQWSTATVFKRGTDSWLAFGDLVA